MLCDMHTYSWKQSLVWQPACLLFFFTFCIILFYKSETSRYRHGTNWTVVPATGGFTLSLTTGVAFIRDNFVDYPDTQLTKREIKARRMQVCRSWVDPSGNLLRRATYLWKFNVLHIQRAHADRRFDHFDYHSNERPAIQPLANNSATRSSAINSTIAREHVGSRGN